MIWCVEDVEPLVALFFLHGVQFARIVVVHFHVFFLDVLIVYHSVSCFPLGAVCLLHSTLTAIHLCPICRKLPPTLRIVDVKQVKAMVLWRVHVSTSGNAIGLSNTSLMSREVKFFLKCLVDAYLNSFYISSLFPSLNKQKIDVTVWRQIFLDYNCDWNID